MGALMDKAWELFAKAESFDEKTRDTTKTEQLRRMAAKAADKYLDQACAAEETALAAGEKHG